MMLPAKPPTLGHRISGVTGQGLPWSLPIWAGQEVTLPLGPQEELKPVRRGQTSGSRPDRDCGDQAARGKKGLGVWGALTAVLGVMAAEGKGEGWGGGASAQDRG